VGKRFTAISVALATLPLAVLTATTSPAIAEPGPNCGAYPAGLAYQIRVSRTPGGKVGRNSPVTLFARVLRNGEICSQRNVRFYTHGPSPAEFKVENGRRLPIYHLSGSDTTDSTGLARLTVTSINDFRFFASYNMTSAENGGSIAVSNARGARSSGVDLVQCSPRTVTRTYVACAG
jgi:hypothetical protein